MKRAGWLLALGVLPGVLWVAGCDDDEGAGTTDATAGADVGDFFDATVDAGRDAGADLSLDAAADAGPDAAADTETDAACTFAGPAVATPAAPPIHTPRWAFEPWISKDISDRADTEAFVAGFKARDIPVGVVVLDSPWETHYNTFIPNPNRYPDFAELVSNLRADGVRTVLWTTQMVNSLGIDFEQGGDRYVGAASNFAEGQLCDFYVNDGAQYTWWKGRGSALDFNNPLATTWWHRQYDALLDLGVAGWKLDFGEQYLRTDEIRTATGTVTLQQYSEKYYEDFYAYGATRQTTAEFITMVRPYDKSYEFEGRFFARPEHAPVAWVGDNRRNWDGLVDALDHLFRSALAGYVVIGSDVGGYLDFEDVGINPGPDVPFDRENFLRWVAVGAMTPFFQLHGRANLAPWTVEPDPDEVVAIYRYWAHLHQALIPFWYSLAERAYAGGPNLMVPVNADEASWAGDWRYTLGDAFLVAPLVAAGGVRSVALPAGADWYDWWQPGADPAPGGTTLANVDSTDLQRIPLYVRAGALIPLHVSNDANALGDAASAGHLTVLAWPGAEASRFDLVDIDERPTALALAPEGAGIRLEIGRAPQPVWVRLRQAQAPARVTGAGDAAESRAVLADQATGWFFDAETSMLWIHWPASAQPLAATVQPPQAKRAR